MEKQQVKDIRTDITCSKRRNPWIVNLSAVIGENYCCKGYRNHGYGEQTQYIGFVGLEDDVEICVAIFKYAVDCILSEIKRIKKENACYYSGYVKKLCDSYGFGFVNGISAAFAAQQKENESGWGLVLVMPKEVEEATQHFGKEQFRAGHRTILQAVSISKDMPKAKSLTQQKGFRRRRRYDRTETSGTDCGGLQRGRAGRTYTVDRQ